MGQRVLKKYIGLLCRAEPQIPQTASPRINDYMQTTRSEDPIRTYRRCLATAPGCRIAPLPGSATLTVLDEVGLEVIAAAAAGWPKREPRGAGV